MSINILAVELLILISDVFDDLQECETHPTAPDKPTRLSP